MKITVFTKNNCPGCRKLENWLENKRPNLDWTEHNIDEDEEAFNYVMSLNVWSMPVTELENGELIVGFDEPKLKSKI